MPQTNPEQRKIYQAAWYAAHKAETSAYGKAYRAAHREKISASKQAYKATHPEQHKAHNAVYRAKHREACRMVVRAWKTTHPEYMPEYTKVNKEKLNLRRTRRYALRANLPATLTLAEWEAIKMAYKNNCAYCGRKPRRLTKDHVIPQSKGGGTTKENIVPACGSCNSKKNRNLPTKPVRLVLL